MATSEQVPPPVPQNPEAPSERKASPKAVAGTVAGGLLVLFAVFNLQNVKIHWVIASTRTPLVVLIAVCAALGFGAGWLFARRTAGRKDKP
jgi:uncharacterized integral membrane protein